jgi:hypothetical protein
VREELVYFASCKKKKNVFRHPFSSDRCEILGSPIFLFSPSIAVKGKMQRSGEWFTFSSTMICRRLELFSLEWAVNFDDKSSIFAAAPYGGPCAISKAVMGGSGFVEVYSASGHAMMEITLPLDAGNVAAMGWNCKEDLVIITDALRALTYSLTGHGAVAHSVKLGDPMEERVVASVARSCGIFVLTSKRWLRGLYTPERGAPESVNIDLSTELSAVPVSLDVIPPECSGSEMDKLLVYVAPSIDDDNPETILVVQPTEEEVLDMKVRIPGGAALLSFSFLAKRLAVFTNESVIMILDPGLQSCQYQFKIGSAAPPLSMHWCSDQFLILTYSPHQFDPSEDESNYSILVPLHEQPVSDHVEQLRWEFDGSGRCHISPEVDGVRATTETACYFIEMVPPSLIDLFAFQSKALSAQVSQGYQAFEKGDVQGFSVVRNMAKTEKFSSVVNSLIEAAACEFGEGNQGRILSLASFARTFCPSLEESESLVETSKKLRLLNTLRRPDCGMPLSMKQFRFLAENQMEVLVNRLINRGQFSVAHDIAQVFKLKVDKVLNFWAMDKVRAALPEEQICREVKGVLTKGKVGFTDAAITAFEVGKRRLAEQLLGCEERTQHQVLLFHELQRDDMALKQAIEGEEADLVYLMIIKLLHQRSSDQQFRNYLSGYNSAQLAFIRAFRHVMQWRPLATAMMEDTRKTDTIAIEIFTHLLKNPIIPHMDSDESERGANGTFDFDNVLDPVVLISEVKSGPTSLEDPIFDRLNRRPPSIVGTETFTLDIFQQAAGLLSSGSSFNSAEPTNNAKMCAVASDLLNEQKQLSEKYAEPCFLNETVHGTIALCLQHKDEKKAEQLRAKYNVSERKWWYIQLQAYCVTGNWEAIDKLGGSGAYKRKIKSPIGFLPFVEALAKRERQSQAAQFVAKLPELCDRVEWYVHLDHFKEAIDDAAAEEDLDLLDQIRRKSSNPSVQQYIDLKKKQLE